MTTILHIDASARVNRSLTRRLSRGFVDAWLARRPEHRVIHRDVGACPPPAISEAWIAAAFAPEQARSAEQRALLALSDEMIAELTAADLIVLGTPMYNYGMPSALKAWVDQVIRIGRTFTFDLARGDFPLAPIQRGKTLVVLSSHGEFGFGPDGMRAARNHLDPHIRTVAHYLGVAEIHTIAIEYQEFGDGRHAASIARAEADAAALAGRLAAGRFAAQPVGEGRDRPLAPA